MAQDWLRIRVDLLAGADIGELWPTPGRLFVVGPEHTFAALAEAINVAFARWDLSHLYEFRLTDGRRIGIPDEDDVLDASRVKVADEAGAEFRYLFDFGDDWVHRCTVVETIDPVAELGGRPAKPVPYLGWGSIPDQYGRRWYDDDGEGEPPPRPTKGDPMLLHSWPEQA